MKLLVLQRFISGSFPRLGSDAAADYGFQLNAAEGEHVATQSGDVAACKRAFMVPANRATE